MILFYGQRQDGATMHLNGERMHGQDYYYKVVSNPEMYVVGGCNPSQVLDKSGMFSKLSWNY